MAGQSTAVPLHLRRRLLSSAFGLFCCTSVLSLLVFLLSVFLSMVLQPTGSSSSVLFRLFSQLLFICTTMLLHWLSCILFYSTSRIETQRRFALSSRILASLEQLVQLDFLCLLVVHIAFAAFARLAMSNLYGPLGDLAARLPVISIVLINGFASAVFCRLQQIYLIRFPFLLELQSFFLVQSTKEFVRAVRHGVIVGGVCWIVVTDCSFWGATGFSVYFHFFVFLSHTVMKSFLTRPQTEDCATDSFAMLNAMEMHDVGSFEHVFTGYYAREVGQTETGQFTEKENSFISTYSLDILSISQQVVEFINRRFHHTKELFFAPKSQELFSLRPRVFYEQLLCCTSFLEFLMISRHSPIQRGDFFSSEKVWNRAFSTCSAVIDSLTFQLHLFLKNEEIYNDSSSANLDFLNISVRNMKPLKEERTQLSKKKKELSGLQWIVFFKSNWNSDRVLVMFKNFELVEKMSDHISFFASPILWPFLIVRQILCRFFVESAISSIFANLQICLWSIEALSNMICASYKEDRHGMVQHTVPAALHCLIGCRLSINSFMDSFAYRRLYFNRNSSEIDKLIYVLDRSIYNIIRVFYSEIQEYSFTPAYVEAIQGYVNFEA